MDHEKGNTLKVYIKQYLNRYKGCFALVAGFMIFYIFTLYLCGISAADIRYFAGLEIVFLVVSAVFCGIRYWYRLRTVKRQIRDYMQGMQTLSDTEDALEEVYMDALEQLQNKRQEEKGAYRNQQREMEEYYALWVHQIKTPISAMRLLLQREEQKQIEDETVGMEKSVLYDMQQELFWINQYVNMALQYQRMNSGMNDLVLEMVSADQVVRTAIRRFAPIMIRKKIAIHYEECREMVLSNVPYKQMNEWLYPIAQKLGIVDILEKYPYEVSGGQKQRAAVARAIITKPELILADEPTGALDSKATDSLLTLFSQINKEGQTVLMVTHSTKAASHANRVLFIKDGEVFHQLYRGSMSNEQLYAKISETLTVLTTGGENYE